MKRFFKWTDNYHPINDNVNSLFIRLIMHSTTMCSTMYSNKFYFIWKVITLKANSDFWNVRTFASKPTSCNSLVFGNIFYLIFVIQFILKIDQKGYLPQKRKYIYAFRYIVHIESRSKSIQASVAWGDAFVCLNFDCFQNIKWTSKLKEG